MAKLVPISSGKSHAIVDDEDYDILMKYKWRLSAGYARHSISNGKVDGRRKFKEIYMHVLLNNTPRGMVTDHIDGNPLNNQKSNLRTATRQQNQQNHPKRNIKATSRFKGVSWCKHAEAWQSSIKHSGKSINIGRFDKEENAAQAYNFYAEKYQGQFARFNTINTGVAA